MKKLLMSKALTHIDDHGRCRMVDVSHKPVSSRQAVAEAKIYLAKTTIDLIEQHKITKGNVLETARLAGIQAAKQTPYLIPLCHPIQLTHIKLDLEVRPTESSIYIQALVKCTERTGVEMESLAAVSVAALTIYDMCKAVDKKMCITDIRLLKKTRQACQASLV